jgi:DNA-binding transcriptional LysR family regulator
MRHDRSVMSDWFRQKKGFSIERLAAMVSVAEHGGIMSAAGGDPNRQSLLSRQIKELEGYFDFALLNRTSTPHQLTEAGRQIAQQTSEFLNALDRSADQFSNDRPLVRIAAGESIIQWLLIPVFSKKLKLTNCPRFQFLNRSSRKTIDHLTSGMVDIGIIKAGDARSHLAFKKIATYHYGIIVNPKLVKLAKSPSWASLSDNPLVIQDNRGRLRAQIEQLNTKAGCGPQVVAECTSFPQVLDMVINSSCIGILPKLAKGQAEAKGCRWIDLKELQSEELSIGVAWDKTRAKANPAVGVVLKWLLG